MLGRVKYLDSGSRNASHAFGMWLQRSLDEAVQEIRLQTAFFNADALSVLASPLKRLLEAGGLVHALLGSNEATTTSVDLIRLVNLLDLPRPAVRLGVVSFGSGFFHPKTFHLRRTDGTQAAYIGSANLTSSGLALHVEAGIVLDSRDGDDTKTLTEIGQAVDAWFQEGRPGLHLVEDISTVTKLLSAGVISTALPPRPTHRGGEAAQGTPGVRRHSLRPLLNIPISRVPEDLAAEPTQGAASTELPPSSVPRPGFPNYLLFAPETDSPTAHLDALSGASLPSGAVGLILRLNRDSARGFAGRSGTANISLPVATASTLRFGLHHGRHIRPRAEFRIQIRYSAESQELHTPPSNTNIMPYGVLPTETGHRDLRMLLPAEPIRLLGQSIEAAGLSIPSAGTLALLEWPVLEAAEFRLTFLEESSRLFREASRIFQIASGSNQLVGTGACWLFPGLSPAWAT